MSDFDRSTVAESRATVLQGTLDLLILKALSAGELHGLGVSRRIEQITRGTFSVEAGALSSSWQPSENNRRAKFYSLTKAGRRRLGDETAQWNRVAVAIAHALET
jgi:PadR family transcriptional regulator PadR